jgi:type II secretory pathway component GspD/PulD (secretin)
MPLYLGIQPDQIPETDQHIRYLYYLANIKPEAEGEGELGTILKTLLPADAVYKIDNTTNALLIMAPARDIKSVMSLIVHLDQPGFQETIEIIKLKHTEATLVANLFNNNIKL